MIRRPVARRTAAAVGTAAVVGTAAAAGSAAAASKKEAAAQSQQPDNNSAKATPEQPEGQAVGFCPHCGKKLIEKSAFCPGCGAKLTE